MSDLTLLENINEHAVLEALKARYAKDDIYSTIGNVIIAVNPNKQIPKLYTLEMMQHYKSISQFESRPHIFGLAGNAFHAMKTCLQDQCVIISGESGAGKTEASKIFLSYVANAVADSHQLQITQIKEQLLNANPILEAFGNSKTIRNDNSSRFGKYMDIQFDFYSRPVGGKITTYLLEKSRVVQIPQKERSFHIFYQLLKASDEKRLESLSLSSKISEYAYLNQSDCSTIPGLDDAREYGKLLKSFQLLQINPEHVKFLQDIVASVLHLGNIKFLNERDKTFLESETPLKNASRLLGVSSDALKNALLFRKLKDQSKQNNTNNGSIVVPLSSEKASFTRDALAKALYGRMFDQLVCWINEQLSTNRRSLMNATTNVIGVLDIFGFEALATNGFEQFVINYCNEKIQQIFIELVLKQEQDEYARENIEWTEISFFNNKTICDLIESKQGIISILDEECVVPGNPTDATFLEKLNSGMASKHAHFDSKSKSQKSKIRHGVFRLKHFAGDVDYDVTGFLQKNRDTLYVDLTTVLNSSSNSLVKKLFPDTQDFVKRPETLASQFRNSMSQLMKNLLSKNPHYIRCIKANNEKKPDFFENDLVLHQIRFLGLVENIKVKVAGFCFRSSMDLFVNHFKMLSKHTWPNPKSKDQRVSIQNIFDDCNIKASEYQLGKTKVFIRHPYVVNNLEAERGKFKHIVATKIRAKWLAHRHTQAFRKTRRLVIKLQACVKRYLARTRYKDLVWASTVFSKNTKRLFLYRAYQKILFRMPKRAAPYIQRIYRRYRARMYMKRLIPSIRYAENWMSVDWPKPCRSRYSAEPHILHWTRIFYNRVMARKYRKALTETQKNKLRWKACAYDHFQQKGSYFDSFHSEFIRVRSEFDEDFLKACETLTGLERSLFQSMIPVQKMHRHSLNKDVPSTILLTPKTIFLFSMEKTLQTKVRADIKDIAGISTSTLSDGTIIIHLPKDKKGDLVARSDKSEQCIEFLSALYLCIEAVTLKEPVLQIKQRIEFQTQGKKDFIEFTIGSDKYSMTKGNMGWVAGVPKPELNGQSKSTGNLTTSRSRSRSLSRSAANLSIRFKKPAGAQQ